MRISETGLGHRSKPIEYDVDGSGCWVCTSHCTDGKGYPVVYRQGRQKAIHRYLKEKETGKTLTSKEYCNHLCYNHYCINPDHIYIGTAKQNSIDMIRAQRGRSQKLTESKVRLIRTFFANVPNEDLGLFFNVNPTTIRHVKSGFNWGWVVI